MGGSFQDATEANGQTLVHSPSEHKDRCVK
jgi:hypothetical protein